MELIKRAVCLSSYLKNPGQFIDKVKKQLYLRRLKQKDVLAWTLEMWKYRGLRMGHDCIIYPSADILSEPFLVELGDNVIITGSVKLLTHDGSTMLFRKGNEVSGVYGRVIIGNNVFIGLGAMILPNVIIGNNVIIGSGSVVRGRIPDNGRAEQRRSLIMALAPIIRRVRLLEPLCYRGA